MVWLVSFGDAPSAAQAMDVEEPVPEAMASCAMVLGCLGLRVQHWGLGVWVSGLRLRVQHRGLGVWVSGFRALASAAGCGRWVKTSLRCGSVCLGLCREYMSYSPNFLQGVLHGDFIGSRV